METKKWEAMLTAVELGSFTRAAERLGLTQSGLTHMMNALEKEVGFPLLLRDRYGVRPTAAGERLLPAVQELMEANRRLEGQIAAQNSWKRENIRVAAYSSICMHWLPTIVQQFRWAYPDVSIDIRIMKTRLVITALYGGYIVHERKKIFGVALGMREREFNFYFTCGRALNLNILDNAVI